METKGSEKSIKGLIKKSWSKSALSRALCVVVAVALTAALAVSAVFIAKLFDKGENVLIGSWHYKAKINNVGDIDCDMHFALDGSIHIVSDLATNSGKYTLVRGGERGAFVTYIAGEELMYDYVYDGQKMIITTQDGFSMTLERLS